MNLQDLVAEDDVLITNDVTRHMLVLTPMCAVFNSFETDDLRNMCVAFGALFTLSWRHATMDELVSFTNEPESDMLMRLVWNEFPEVKPVPKRNHLTLVK
jgi:hypothetical protein